MKWAKALRLASLVGGVAAACCCTPNAGARQTTNMTASLTPEFLGAGTTINVGFRISAPHNGIPSPLTAVDLRYPANINIVDSGLGLVACPLTTLESIGPEGCAAESLMGRGSAEIELPIGSEVIRLTGNITAWMAPIEHGHLGLVFYGETHTPVAAEVSFPGIVESAPPPYGLSLNARIPNIASFPEAAEPSVVKLDVSIGPRNVTYYNRRHGKYVPYQPDGLVLPTHCPTGGFPFAATFTFLDNTRTTAKTTVPCPHHQDSPREWSGRREAPGLCGGARPTGSGFLSPPIDPCVRFSRTRLADVLHRRHSAAPVPWLVGARWDDDPVEVDQAQVAR